MRTLTLAVLLGLVVTSGSFAQMRGGGIMNLNKRMKPPLMNEEGEEKRQGRREMGEMMAPVFGARGFAIGGEAYELFGIHLFPKPSEGEEYAEGDESVDGEAETTSTETGEMDRPPLGGICGIGQAMYLLKNVEVELEEVQDEEVSDEASNEGDGDAKKRRRRRRRPGKIISAVTATLCKAPEMKTLDNSELDEDGDDDTVVEEVEADVEGLEEIGTLSLMIEVKEARMFEVPVVRGEITVDGTTYEIYAKLARGRGPRGPGRGRNGEDDDEGEENNDDDDYDE